MGFVGPGQNRLVENLGIKKDEKNVTSLDGIFVAGDMSRGASLVVHAISNGMQTGRDVTAYLNGRAQA